MKKQPTLLLILMMVALGFSCETESPTPAASELGGKKLSYYTEFFYNQISGFQPQNKVRYEYDKSGRLTKYVVYGYDQHSLVEQHYYNFTYVENRVDNITGYFTTDKIHPFVRYHYEYDPDLHVTKIKQENFQAGINSELTLDYDFNLNTVEALYTFSNGQSFTYNYELIDNNISADRTNRGSEICNTGSYTYDNGINPFSQLGYIDYSLSNISVNNKLTERVDYLNCAFPSLVPQSYTHVYDDMGYPITTTTYYKSGGMSKRVFIYN